MIPRYTRPEMGNIWTEDNKFAIWLEIEVLACEAMAEIGVIPKEAAKTIREKASFETEKILAIEEVTKHDVIAFLTNVEEYVGEPSRYIHLGMTSSDVLDTCLALQCKQAGELLIEDIKALRNILARRAVETKDMICIGRSHGIHAEPMSFGLKFANWYDESGRCLRRMITAVDEIATGQISGAVGTYEHISPKIEEFVCKKLGLHSAAVSSQVISRDRHAEFLWAMASTASLLEKIATEIRHLQRTEVLEAEEYFSKGQKGSSAMPHKRNPISSENICGQARLIRSNLLAAIENNALWHERDISHSSIERIILPDSTISLDYILNRMTKLLDKLIVYPENMQKNLNLTKGLFASQKVLLALAKKGLHRQRAYELVQKSAMHTWETGKPFFDSLLENDEVMEHFKKEELQELFSYAEIMKGVNYIFKKCGL